LRQLLRSGPGSKGLGAARKGVFEPSDVFVEPAKARPNVAQVRNGETRQGADQRIEEARSGTSEGGARKRADNRKDDTHQWIHRLSL
jgi:hypothetical protein